MIGYWTEFPFLDLVLDLRARRNSGVMYSIPAAPRVGDDSDLPYPEGVACAEVLKVGRRQRGEQCFGC
jgi:uncharacterized oligopeptide transporter (OPT) family protein